LSVLRPIANIGDQRKGRLGRYLVVLVIGLGLGGLGGFLLGRSYQQTPEPASNPVPTTVVSKTAGPTQAHATDASQPTAAQPKKPAPPAFPDDMRHIDVSITGSLYATLAKHIDGRHADILNAQVGRILVWWFDLRRDVLKKDQVQLVYQPVDDATEIQLLAVRYTSRKMNKTYAAYRFKTSQARYPRFYDQAGQEIELRLANSPLTHYEQVTELMNMAGRRHRGIDFKADVGTDVVAPYKSKVMRRNWRTRRNGNCLQLVFLDTGITALFLHLDEVLPATQPGKIVEAGTVVARSGNTGHSTAPHLHYELHNPAGKPINPLKVHKTLRVKLPEDEKQKFNARKKYLDSLLEGGSTRESAPKPSGSSSAKVTPG